MRVHTLTRRKRRLHSRLYVRESDCMSAPHTWPLAIYQERRYYVIRLKRAMDLTQKTYYTRIQKNKKEIFIISYLNINLIIDQDQ